MSKTIVSSLFVIHVNVPKVTNFHTLYLLVCQLCLCNKYFQMFGVLLFPLLVATNIMLASLTISANSHGYIYLKRNLIDVFQNFTNLVERRFNKKIVTMQTDWGGEYEKLNPFFQKLGIAHHV